MLASFFIFQYIKTFTFTVGVALEIHFTADINRAPILGGTFISFTVSLTLLKQTFFT